MYIYSLYFIVNHSFSLTNKDSALPKRHAGGQSFYRRYSAMINILVVEDDNALRKVICTVLEKNGYTAFPAVDGDDALAVLDRAHIDLIISDIMMPNTDGYTLTRELREADYNQPILLVTAKGSFEDKRIGFNCGADDYMVKPINMEEMLLRVGALLRRAKINSERRLNFGGTTLDYDSLTVTQGDASFLLPQKEFYLLYKLLSYPNKIFTRAQIMDQIWGIDSDTDERTIDVHVNRLREKFKGCPDFEIVTVRGLGYKAVVAK